VTHPTVKQMNELPIIQKTYDLIKNYNDASLLQSQADRLYQTAENLETVIGEQEE
jgi:hypothetical protein